MSWKVFFKKRSAKQMLKLPGNIIEAARALVREIEALGKPTYIACWEVHDKTIKIVEVYYVGTHEKAPY